MVNDFVANIVTQHKCRETRIMEGEMSPWKWENYILENCRINRKILIEYFYFFLGALFTSVLWETNMYWHERTKLRDLSIS